VAPEIADGEGLHCSYLLDSNLFTQALSQAFEKNPRVNLYASIIYSASVLHSFVTFSSSLLFSFYIHASIILSMCHQI